MRQFYNLVIILLAAHVASCKTTTVQDSSNVQSNPLKSVCNIKIDKVFYDDTNTPYPTIDLNNLAVVAHGGSDDQNDVALDLSILGHPTSKTVHVGDTLVGTTKSYNMEILSTSENIVRLGYIHKRGPGNTFVSTRVATGSCKYGETINYSTMQPVH